MLREKFDDSPGCEPSKPPKLTPQPTAAEGFAGDPSRRFLGSSPNQENFVGVNDCDSARDRLENAP
jgi:hypothetical protein